MKLKDYMNINYKKGEWVYELPFGPYGKSGKGRIVEVNNNILKVKFLYDINLYEYKFNEVTKNKL